MTRRTQRDDAKPLPPRQVRQKLHKGLCGYLAGNDPGPIVFRIQLTKRASETYPLKLTQPKRESMIHCTRIKNKVKERLKAVGGGTQVVGVTYQELDHLNDELGEAALYATDYHLHQFDIDGERYGPPAPDDLDFGMEMRDETDVLLSQLIPKSGRKPRWIYEYDFGDGWRHEVLFEGFPPSDPKTKYPLCVEGERACPPEDCGGPPGYADYLAAIADPQHGQYEDCWNGEDRSIPKPSMRRTRRGR
jgi:hypothetical protein